ncbi:MAG TPA: hypothetical protein ENN67_06745 [Firmicutes bacterium]|nr:hypothetical protein [Bacillota bacterium]
MNRVIICSLFIVLLVSCSKHDPISTNENNPDAKLIQDFNHPGQVIIPNAVDADIATIINGPGTGDYSQDRPWVDGQNRPWAVATGLHLMGANQQQIMYRFVSDNTKMGQVLAVPGIIGTGQKRLPRVAACYVYDADHPNDPNRTFIEVAIAYQYRANLQDETKWQIRVKRMGFSVASINNNNFVHTWQVNEIAIDNFGNDDNQPDIAYDPTGNGTSEGGNLYVVFSRIYSAGDKGGAAEILMRRGERLYDENSNMNMKWTWYPDAGIPVQRYEESPSGWGADLHNGYLPRIDIGKVIFPAGTSHEWKIAIAYTGGKYKNISDMGWHVRINYWDIIDIEDDDPLIHKRTKVAEHNHRVYSGQFPYFPSGLPMLDIGDPGSNHAALVWNQAKSHDWKNVTIVYGDIHGGFHQFSNDASWIAECFASPSVVAVLGSHPHYYSSVSFLRSENYLWGHWNPIAQSITRTVAVEPDDPLTSIGEIKHDFGHLYGAWEPGAMVSHSLGMSTAMSSFGANYWMVWSGYETEGGPCHVYGSFGNTS